MGEESAGDGNADRRGRFLPVARLRTAQTRPRERWALTIAAAAVGLGLATAHWGGLVAGGALVGLCWPTFRRALVAGLAFGVVALAAFAGRLALAGTLGHYLGMGPLLAISVAVPLVAGPLGASARGLFPDAA